MGEVVDETWAASGCPTDGPGQRREISTTFSTLQHHPLEFIIDASARVVDAVWFPVVPPFASGCEA